MDYPLYDRLAPHLERLQRIFGVTGAVSFVLGFLASIDVLLLPRGPSVLAWLFHLLLLAAGAAAGFASVGRSRQIDRRRWEIVGEPLLTEGEREHAHREAERERRAAGTMFFIGPLLIGYWMAYQLGDEKGGDVLTYLLIVSPMLGFVAGLLAGNRVLGEEPPPV